MRSLVTVAFAILALQVGAEESPAAKLVLDQAERATPSRAQVGPLAPAEGPAIAEFWDGCEPGTEMEFGNESTVDGKKREWTVGFRVVKRAGRKVTLSMKSEGTEQEVVLEGLPKDSPVERDPMAGEAADRVVPGRETLKIGDKEYSCTVYERTMRISLECGNDPREYMLHRVLAWHCADVAVQGGLLKVRITEEGKYKSGFEVAQSKDLVVTNLDATKKIEDVAVPCYEVALSGTWNGKPILEAKQLRKDTIPGGVLESTEKEMAPGTDPGVVETRRWVKKMSILRAAEIEKPK